MVGRTGDATVGDATVEPRDTIEIVNVVASTGIGIEINLKQVTLALEGADYDPERSSGPWYGRQGPETVQDRNLRPLKQVTLALDLFLSQYRWRQPHLQFQ